MKYGHDIFEKLREELKNPDNVMQHCPPEEDEWYVSVKDLSKFIDTLEQEQGEVDIITHRGDIKDTMTALGMVKEDIKRVKSLHIEIIKRSKTND